jgi:hypothetical protein
MSENRVLGICDCRGISCRVLQKNTRERRNLLYFVLARINRWVRQRRTGICDMLNLKERPEKSENLNEFHFMRDRDVKREVILK